MVLFGIVSFIACARNESRSRRLDNQAIDPESARKLSDGFATDLIQDRRRAIRIQTERVFQDLVDERHLDSILDQMNETYGKPLQFKFKQVEWGSKEYDSGTKEMYKFWYSAQTTKYESGSHFLVVEVVQDGDRLAVSSFSIVNFPLGVPPNLK